MQTYIIKHGDGWEFQTHGIYTGPEDINIDEKLEEFKQLIGWKNYKHIHSKWMNTESSEDWEELRTEEKRILLILKANGVTVVHLVNNFNSYFVEWLANKYHLVEVKTKTLIFDDISMDFYMEDDDEE
jgi:hypothetical protein